jgi:hypothetical protein
MSCYIRRAFDRTQRDSAAMDDTSYFRELEAYRTRSVEELAEELRTLRRQMKDPNASSDVRRAAVECFGIAWHVYEEKGGDIRMVFPLLFE